MNQKTFPFHDAPNTATLVCCHVMNRERPILFASHDEEDGMWQFLCGGSHKTEDAHLIALHEVFELDNSIGALAEMPCGCCAERKNLEDKWAISRCNL